MEDVLVSKCLEQLEALPFVRRAALDTDSREGGLDGRLTITTPTGKVVLPCEIKRSHLRRESAQLLPPLSARHPGLIVLAPLVGRDLGDILESKGVNFVDAVGNCHVRLGDQYVSRVQGRSPEERAPEDRALRAPAYRALFAFLARPELLAASTRTVAALTDISPQTVSDLRNRLVHQGLVLEAGVGRRWTPGRRKHAMDLWLAGFSSTLKASLVLGRYRAKERDPRDLEQRIESELDALCEWRYGGGAAAMRLTKYYRGDTTLIYLRQPPSDLTSRLQLVRDTAGPLTLLHAPGSVAFEGPDPHCVHPLLVYADLLAENDERASEAATEVYERFLGEMDRRA